MAGLFNANSQLEALLERQREQNQAQQQQFGQLFGAAAGNRRQAAANTVGAQVGASFGQGLAGGLFGESDEVKKARELVEQEKSLQQRLGNLNPNDPSSYLKIGQELNRAGLTKEGIAFMEQGQALAKEARDKALEQQNITDTVTALQGQGVDADLIKGVETKQLSMADAVKEQRLRSEVKPPPTREYEKDGMVITEQWDEQNESYTEIARSPKGKAYRPVEEEMLLNAEAKRGEKLAETRAKGIAEREAEDISSATLAVEAVPILSRTVDLLQDIGTGGIQGAVLKAKNYFGIASGDEQELLNNMNKLVLQQLRPVFGSQFTKSEGDWLKAIEAGESRSTQGNIRLMETGVELARKRINTGIEAAREAGDGRELRRLEKAKASLPTTSLTDVPIASNGNGKLIYNVDGKWVNADGTPAE